VDDRTAQELGKTSGGDLPAKKALAKGVGGSSEASSPQESTKQELCDSEWLRYRDETGRFASGEKNKGNCLLARSSTKVSRVRRDGPRRQKFTPRQRFLALDAWLRSKLSAGDFGPLIGVSKHTLYSWKKAFEAHGPAGLEAQQSRRKKGSRLDEFTQRAILLLKESHPAWGIDRIHDVLVRSDGISVSASTISGFLKQNGYEPVCVATKPHPDKPRRFERPRPNNLWQTDLFTFVLKRQNRRVHLVGYMDDHSRFIVGHGLSTHPTSSLVIGVLEQAISNYGAPEEVLTDNGSQYVTWRGKSAFSKRMEKLGIQHRVARPRRPQTLGKIERYWSTLWQECLGEAIFLNFDDAKMRVSHFIDHYNFQRPHQGIKGLVPADRFFGAAPEVKASLAKRVADNAIELARYGVPRKGFYLTGRVGDESISLHAEGSRVVLNRDGQEREEVDLSAPGKRLDPAEAATQQPLANDGAPEPLEASVSDEELAPGQSPLDEPLALLRKALGTATNETVEELQSAEMTKEQSNEKQ